ncbi:MAG: BppU family phage baseplate upper protein [Tetragenococcus koreensis]|nr:BppU family phage baseplate upper protein [Tetragenococcus koreensis]
MPVLKKGEIKVRATAYGTEVKSTGYVFYSYDKNSSALFFQFRNQNGEPTDIANAKIHLLMILEDDEGKEFIPGQEDFEIISKPGGKAKFVLPEMLLSYQGKVTGYINLDFEDGSQTDEGQFSFRIRRSMITRVLPAMGDKYVQDFEDIKERVEQAEDSTRNDFKDSVERVNKAETKAKSDMQESVDQVNKDYEAWKSEQKQENQDFQNEYKQHWQNFKNTQNKNRTDFEDDFKKWKTTQENKQNDFATTTNETHNKINDDIEKIEQRVEETNNELENLDAYTKVETDEKLKEKADKTDVDDLNKKIDTYYDNLFETEVLFDGMNSGYGIYLEESQKFEIAKDKNVEKLVFLWSRHQPSEESKNYAFSSNIVEGSILRDLQRNGSEVRVILKPIESRTSSFKKIYFTKDGLMGTEDNTSKFENSLDNKYMVLRKLYVVYRKEV